MLVCDLCKYYDAPPETGVLVVFPNGSVCCSTSLDDLVHFKPFEVSMRPVVAFRFIREIEEHSTRAALRIVVDYFVRL